MFNVVNVSFVLFIVHNLNGGKLIYCVSCLSLILLFSLAQIKFVVYFVQVFRYHLLSFLPPHQPNLSKLKIICD